MAFNFGSNTQTPATSSTFSFGKTATTNAPVFSFGNMSSTNPSTTSTGGFNFGNSLASNLGTNTTPTQATTLSTTASGFPGFNLTTNKTSAPASSNAFGGFTFSNTQTITSTPTLNFGKTDAAKQLGVSTSASVAPAPVLPTFSSATGQKTTNAGNPPSQLSALLSGSTNFTGFGTSSTTTKTTNAVSGQLTLGNMTASDPNSALKSSEKSAETAVTTSTVSGLSLGLNSQPTLNFSTTKQSTTLPSNQLNLGPLSTATTTTGAFSTVATSGASNSVTTTSTDTIAADLTYKQLENMLNKWNTDLEDLEKAFLQQATEINAWDRILIDNGDQVTKLHSDVKIIRTEQGELIKELDLLLESQKELDELLKPMEEEIEKMQPNERNQHVDMEREATYRMAEKIGAQMKVMNDDLKEIIEFVNRLSVTKYDSDKPDAIAQITKILNTHMDSLQWIDRSTGVLNKKVDELQKRLGEAKRIQDLSSTRQFND